MESTAALSEPPLAPAPANALDKLPLIRNAWLVNLFTLVTLVLSAVLVAFLKTQIEAEKYVLIGVAGSSYAVMQTWSLVQCSRALRQGSSYLSSYFALTLSLLLFNAFILAIHFSTDLSIHPIREGLLPTALPVIVPMLSMAVLLTLPLARVLERRFAPGPRARTALRAGLAAGFSALLLPVPLFIYTAQFVIFDDPDDPSQLARLWRPLLLAAPESLGNLSLACVDQTRFAGGVLRTGRVSTARLLDELNAQTHIRDTLKGLGQKERGVALKAVLQLSLKSENGAALPASSAGLFAEFLVRQLSREKLDAVLLDERYSSEVRSCILSLLAVFRNPESLRALTDILIKQEPCLYEVYRIYTRHHSRAEIKELWRDWLQETDANRARGYATLLVTLSPSLRLELLDECLKQGSAVMCEASLLASWPGTPRQTDDYLEILTAYLERSESLLEPHRHACAILLKISGRLRGAAVLSDDVMRATARETREYLNLRQNSASQALPGE